MSIYAWIAAVGIALTLLSGSYWKGVVVGREEKAAELTVCTARTADKDVAITSQNTAIAALQVASITRAKASANALKAAQANTAANRKTISTLMSAQPVGDQCAAAEQLIREGTR